MTQIPYEELSEEGCKDRDCANLIDEVFAPHLERIDIQKEAEQAKKERRVFKQVDR